MKSKAAILAMVVGTSAQAQLPKDLFEAIRQDNTPYSSDQTKILLEDNYRAEKARSWKPQGNPQTTTESIRVSLKPGEPIPEVAMYNNLTSSLCFLDRTGNPWTVVGAEVLGEPNGKKNLFTLSQPLPHTVQLTALGPPGKYNVVVILEGLNTPISVNAIVEQKATLHHSRLDLHVDGCRAGGCARSAKAAPPPDFNSAMFALIDGIPPDGAQRRAVPGSYDTEIWELDGKFYIRTSETLRLPACLPGDQARRATDGLRACITNAVSSLLVSRNGKNVTLPVE